MSRGLRLFSLLVLSACATPSGSQFAELEQRLAPVPSGHGRLFFCRPSALLSIALTPSIQVGGRAVGQSRNGTWFFVDLPVGTHYVTLDNTISLSLGEGQRKYVYSEMKGRMGPALATYYDMRVEEVPPSTAYTCLAASTYIGSTPLPR